MICKMEMFENITPLHDKAAEPLESFIIESFNH